ncbi:MAG TPA: DUF3108 domain-containing protein [Anaeromyxobacteraceae bacterium]|nr:DUF3108 domain-containing protein [Anaeromyxobacteraceae bacterium]
MLPAVLALALAAPECGLPPLADAPPFRVGETLAYDLDVLGVVKAGTATLSVEPPISRGTLLPLRARVRNISVFAKARHVKGYALSWVDARTLRPQRYLDDVEEDGVRKSTDTRLDRPGPITMEWRLGERRGTTTAPREREVLDLLSAIYYLRAIRLEPGTRLCFDLVANRRIWRLDGEVAPGHEKVDSAAGSFDTVRVDAVLTRADGTGARRPVHFWYSRGEHRLPVAAVSEIDLGPVRAMLARVSAPATPPAK